MDKSLSKVLVVGAGISGICAALELAETGKKVVLVEASPVVGGILNQLDQQFPNDHCGICRILPMMDRDAGSQFCVRRGFFHENITAMTSTRVVSVKKSPGHFTIYLKNTPEGIEPEKCTSCKACLDVCPISVPDLFNGGITDRKAVYFPTPTRIPSTPVIDWEACTKCNACVEACPENAVNLKDEPRETILEDIGGIIVAPGTPLVDPAPYDVYGYGVLPNVVTATAFERMVSGSGPYGGKPVRPSDGKPISRIAWIQCVGSRNVMIQADHCSSACCMFAVKEAMMAKEKIGPATDTTIFYMDMRTFGRDFQRYRDAAEKKHGVKFIRCRVHSLEPGGQPDDQAGDRAGDVKLTYLDESGGQMDETFDLVVLSTGQKPKWTVKDTASWILPGEGIEIIDSALGLKDISASVIGANKAVVRLGQTIKDTAVMETEKDIASKDRDRVFKARHRLCVILCREENDSSGMDWEQIESELKRLPGEQTIASLSGQCSSDNWQAVKKILNENNANRLILVTSKPYQLSQGIKELFDHTGLLSSQVEVVDLHLIMDPVTGPVTDTVSDTVGATNTALKSILMAANRLRTRKPQSGMPVAVSQRALVVGGGPSGLSAAAALSGQGIHVTLVEKSHELGGNLTYIVDPEAREKVKTLVEKANADTHITIEYESTIVRSFGTPGRFRTVMQQSSGEERTIDHGVFIVATGGGSAKTNVYEYGKDPRIITQFELEQQLAGSRFKENESKTVVMIQCAGSREEPQNYCSRICCLKALKNAIQIREEFPETDVYVFYRDIMAYGESEQIYTQARQKGVLFIPFKPEDKPCVSVKKDEVIVEGTDPVLGEPVRFKPDILALSTGLIPNKIDELESVLEFEMTTDGFVQEADSKWRPVDTGKEGIFVCGLARNPLKVEEAMVEGEAAAQRALRILLKQVIVPQRVAARVRNAVCSKCEMCIDACMYGARFFDEENEQVAVDPASCQGCGTCAAVCPNSATVIGDFEDEGVMGAIEAALE